MNNHIKVSHSNNTTIYYTEGPVVDVEAIAAWRVRRAVAAFLLLALIVILVNGGARILLAFLAVYVAAWLAIKGFDAMRESGRRHRRAQAALAARADTQHAALMRGDMTTGVYGIYPPAKETV